MANAKITALTAVSAAAAAMVLPVVEDPSGTPVTKKVTLAQIKTLMLASLQTDMAAAFTDVTTGNAATTKHGFAPKLSGVPTQFWNGVGGWSIPAGGSGGVIGHNVKDYGALGNTDYNAGGGSDDTTAIQAAYDAAALSTGYACVYFPKGAYRITSTINVPAGVHSRGIGGQSYGGILTPPMLVWDGVDNGIMCNVNTLLTNIPTTLFENLCFFSASSGITNKAINCVKWTGSGGGVPRLDTGSGFKDCFFQGPSGDAIYLSASCTNFYLGRGRFDTVGGYGIYVDLTANGASFIGTIDGNPNWVGGTQGQGKGLIYLNGEGATADGSESILSVSGGLHTEVNQSLTQTYASGTNPYDKCGIIRLGVTPARGNMQHRINIDSWANSNTGGVNSYSAVQITAASGTAAAAADCCYVQIDNFTGLSSGTTENGATDQVRLIGGLVPTISHYPFPSVRGGRFTWGTGKDSAADATRSFWYQRHGTAVIRGLGFIQETVAGLEAPWLATVGIAVVSDGAVGSSVGTTIANGGSKICIVASNGSAWKTIAVLN